MFCHFRENVIIYYCKKTLAKQTKISSLFYIFAKQSFLKNVSECESHGSIEQIGSLKEDLTWNTK